MYILKTAKFEKIYKSVSDKNGFKYFATKKLRQSSYSQLSPYGHPDITVTRYDG